MKGYKTFLEQTSKKLIVVDIQPAYKGACQYLMGGFAKFIAQYQEVLILYVGELTGDTKSTIAKYYYQHGVPKASLYSYKWFDKGYAFFRNMMDSRMCFHRDDIIKVVQYMISKRVNDIRDLKQKQITKLAIPDLNYDSLEDYFIHIPDLKLLLRKWNGADICGGGLNECLEEVLILADAMNIQYNIIQEFVY